MPKRILARIERLAPLLLTANIACANDSVEPEAGLFTSSADASSADTSSADASSADATNVDGGADVSAEAAPAADAPPQPGDGGCQPAFTSAICDPVCNTNCPALQRCDVSNNPRTGVCIGIWISGEGATCTGTATSDPCASMLTCLNGTCRHLCYRNADCTTAGTCCNTSIDLNGAPSGFSACSPCGT